jgi:hypothetical protein
MLLAPLIIVVAGIVCVTSRIVRGGWVRRNVRTIIGGAHLLEKSASGFEVQAYIAYLRGSDVLRTSALRRSSKFVSRALNEAKRSPTEKTMSRASLSSRRAKPDLALGADQARQIIG